MTGGRNDFTWNIEAGSMDFPRLISIVRESGRPEYCDRERANARLIAAAPDMAEALQAICDNNSAPHPIMDMARAALAKAREESA